MVSSLPGTARITTLQGIETWCMRRVGGRGSRDGEVRRRSMWENRGRRVVRDREIRENRSRRVVREKGVRENRGVREHRGGRVGEGHERDVRNRDRGSRDVGGQGGERDVRSRDRGGILHPAIVPPHEVGSRNP